MSAEDQTTYLFDDFFASPEQKTVTVPIKIMGRSVPIVLKAGMSVEDRMASQRAAVKRQVKPDGTVVVLGVDDAEAAYEMVLRCIVSWPFVTREGSPVPVTKANLQKLLGGIDDVAEAIKQMDAGGADSLVPFVKPSEAV